MIAAQYGGTLILLVLLLRTSTDLGFSSSEVISSVRVRVCVCLLGIVSSEILRSQTSLSRKYVSVPLDFYIVLLPLTYLL